MCVRGFAAKSPIVATHFLPLHIPDHNPPPPLYLRWMCPVCLVPYPIILCQCSKAPCSSTVTLTCSTFLFSHKQLALPATASLHLRPSSLHVFFKKSIFPPVCAPRTPFLAFSCIHILCLSPFPPHPKSPCFFTFACPHRSVN